MQELIPIPRHQLIGHRGVGGLRPENTFSSFEYALQLGLNWVEFDVQLSKDEQWVVMHDTTIDRTTNGKGPVSAYTVQELQKFDAGSWFGPEYSDQVIPTLSDVMELMAARDLQANIEIKGSEQSSTKHATIMAEFMGSYVTSLDALPLISSYDTPTLIALRKLSPKFPIGYLIEKFTRETIAIAKDQAFTCINCDVKNMTEDYLSLAIENQIPVLLYTINNATLGQQWLSKGIAAIFTDRPDLFLK